MYSAGPAFCPPKCREEGGWDPPGNLTLDVAQELGARGSLGDQGDDSEGVILSWPGVLKRSVSTVAITPREKETN